MIDRSDLKVVFIPGIGGIDAYAQEAINALSDFGFDVEPVGWTKYRTSLMAFNFFDNNSQRTAVERVRNLLLDYETLGKQVVIISHSRGASIHSRALALSNIRIKLSVQMAAGYASEKLLAKSAELSENNLFLTSAKDIVLLSGVLMHGRPLLGRNGPSGNISNLDLLAYNPDWHAYNHKGAHEHFLRGDFITGFVSPLIKKMVCL